MALLYRFSRQALGLKTLHHHRRAAALPFLSTFSTSAAESADATEPDDGPVFGPEPPPNEPPPIGVAVTEKVGRAAFAAELLPAGQPIHLTRPIVAHPSLHMMNCLCYNCLRRLPKPAAAAEAEAPPAVKFCSEKCEEDAKEKFYNVEKQADWSRFHEYCRQEGLEYPLLIKRFACRVISRNIISGIFELLAEDNSPEKASMVKEDFALLRSALEEADIKVEKKEKEKEKEEVLSADGEDKEAEDVEDVEDALEAKDAEEAEDAEDAEESKDAVEANDAEAKDPDESPLSFLTKEWYTDVLGRIRVNSFQVELPVQSHKDLKSAAAASVEGEAVEAAAASVKGEAVGNAMYMLASFYNHSCEPNTKIEWTDNVEAQMVALRDIELDEELRICYVDPSLDTEARQKLLKERYGFQCDCPRCVPTQPNEPNEPNEPSE